MTLTRDPGTGRFASTTLGSVQTGLAYNGFGEVSSFTSSASGAGLYDVTYTYDGLGRLDPLSPNQMAHHYGLLLAVGNSNSRFV